MVRYSTWRIAVEYLHARAPTTRYASQFGHVLRILSIYQTVQNVVGKPLVRKAWLLLTRSSSLKVQNEGPVRQNALRECRQLLDVSTLMLAASKGRTHGHGLELACVSPAAFAVLRRERSETSRHVRDQLQYGGLVLLLHALVVSLLLFGTARGAFHSARRELSMMTHI